MTKAETGEFLFDDLRELAANHAQQKIEFEKLIPENISLGLFVVGTEALKSENIHKCVRSRPASLPLPGDNVLAKNRLMQMTLPRTTGMTWMELLFSTLPMTTSSSEVTLTRLISCTNR